MQEYLHLLDKLESSEPEGELLTVIDRLDELWEILTPQEHELVEQTLAGGIKC